MVGFAAVVMLLARKGELDPVEHVEDLCPELQIERSFISVIFAREKLLSSALLS